MARGFLVVMDSLGIGGAADAGSYFNEDRPDTGANTLGHILQSCPIPLPNLDRLGLGAALNLASGLCPAPLSATAECAIWGVAEETASGKDTPSGHWEMTGCILPWAWHYFPRKTPTFPDDLVAAVTSLAGVDGILGNCHASGTEIIARLGGVHLRTGHPICYTSADSVFQIAAHEQAFGLQRLYDLCAALAPHLHKMRVGRVIARPFIGEEGAFQRTENRRDYAMPPPNPTLLDHAKGAGRTVIALGKISDIFAHRGITETHKGSDAALVDHLGHAIQSAPDGSLTVANFVEFDARFGHRRDVAGYAAALAWFDRAIGPWIAQLRAGDMMILTADHGNDPTWTGTDHTRERVPFLVAAPDLAPRALGLCGFADIGATLAAHLALPPLTIGRPAL
ncbi:phosphopentomutase [Rhodobacteraceae bacterium XHP0102]|nr:phosphopentomutase [Rhodobacteraceae bacterium XHP0102]